MQRKSAWQVARQRDATTMELACQVRSGVGNVKQQVAVQAGTGR